MQKRTKRFGHRAAARRLRPLETLEPRCVLAAEPLLISEFMAANVASYKDRFQEYSDWIEIYNPTDDTVSLENWSLTDDPAQPQLWVFPAVSISAHDTLMVFASSRDRRLPTSQLHTNFQLGSEGEYLGLIRPDGTVAHEYAPQYLEQRGDVSYGVAFGAQGPRLGEHQYFGPSTPDAANQGGYTEFARPVTFSVARGFYDQPLDVALATEGVDHLIRYTLDGSAPTREHGEVYGSPLHLTTTTTLRALAYSDTALPSEIETNSYLFLDDVLHQTGAGLPQQWGYFDDQGPARPARGKANYAMDPDVVNNSLYRDTLKDDLRSLPTLSLVLDPADLWDLDTGLYTNPEQRGDSWERPVSMEWIEPNGTTGFELNAGIQVHGGWARRISQTAKFSFRVSFKGQYGDPLLEYPLFGADAAQAYDELVLRGGFNDSWANGDRNNTYLQDSWTRQTQREMGGDAPHQTFVHLYLNGLYWGMYSPTERPNAMWAAFYQGGDPSEYDVINTGGNLVAGDSTAWTQLVRGLAPARYNYEAIKKLVDLESFADYLIVNQYIGNWDWPHNNWYASRRRTDDGQWHFHSWDAEAAFQQGTTVDRVNTGITPAVGPSDLYLALRGEADFQRIFADRVAQHFYGDGVLTPAKDSARLDELAAKIDRAIVAESARWGDGRTDSVNPSLTRDNAWRPRISALHTQYFPRRGASLVAQYRAGSLFPDVDPPSMTPAGGRFGSPTDVLITAGAGDIYYTTDGTDPLTTDGTLSPQAVRLNSRDLLLPTSPAALRVPTGAATEADWTGRQYDDSHWQSGQAAFGYDNGVSDDPISVPDGFRVHEVVSTVSIGTLDDVDALLAGANVGQTKTVTGIPTINYHAVGRDAHFANSLDFPISGNNFAVDVSGKLVVHQTGTYTFGVTSNDSARLSIDGKLLYADTGRHNATDTFVTLDLTAGEHDVQLTMFQRLGSATLEFYVARGVKTVFDESFSLVGDQLEVPYGALLLTDVQDGALDRNASVYARIPFTVDQPGDLRQLQLRIRYDDGFVAYLNGTEVARRNAPELLVHDSTASTSRPDRTALVPETIDLSEFLSVLQAGDNVLALQLLNASPNDNDLIVLPQLVGLVDSQPFTVADSAHVKARVVLDGAWSALVSGEFIVAAPATADEVRISEVHYHPSEPSAEERAAGFGSDSDFEFLELINVSSRAIDLSAVSLLQSMNADDIQGVAFDFSDSPVQVLSPGEYVVIVKNTEAFRLRYGSRAVVAGEWSGGLSNSRELLTLAANGVLLQQFAYRDDWHAATDGAGSSLERTNPADPALDAWSQASAWRASYELGGSPGYAGGALPGDANRDGRFDSDDLLLVMQAAEFEDELTGNSTWEEGDWNGDGEFTSRDLVAAFTLNEYQRQTPVPVAARGTHLATDAVWSQPTRPQAPTRSLEWGEHDELVSLLAQTLTRQSTRRRGAFLGH